MSDAVKGLILGTGSFGCALAHLIRCATAPSELVLWARRETAQNEVTQKHPHMNVQVSCDLNDCLTSADYVVYALPAQIFRTFFETIKPHLPPHMPLLVTAKGLEDKTGAFFDDILHDLGISNSLVIFSGPHLAHEVMRNAPTLGLLAGPQDSTQLFKKVFEGPKLVIHCQEDVRAPMIANAFKNVFAFMGGILRGEGAAQNTLNSFLALGFNEMCRFGAHWKRPPEAFMQPALLGDFMLTTQSLDSRNTKAGITIGSGLSLAPGMLAEGIDTLSGLLTRADKEGLQLPLCHATKRRLSHKAPLKEQLRNLIAP